MMRASPSATSRARKLPIAATRAKWASGCSETMLDREVWRNVKKSAGGMVKFRLHTSVEVNVPVPDLSGHLGVPPDLAQRGESGPAIVGHHNLGIIIERHAYRYLVTVALCGNDHLLWYVRCRAGQ